jgi:energy-coupling factor transporter ATP-binding protein EcfA2
MQLEGMFDLTPAVESTVDIPGLPPLDNDWSIGLIVGPSGAGKSTVARDAFGSLVDPRLDWPKERSVIDAFPESMGIREVTELMSSVGFSSPPAWLRPYDRLSTGEKFRVTMARLLAENPKLIVVDEYTSVIDRVVAQIGSSAIAKTIRRRGQKFVAVTCHYDVEDWLQPDWVFQPHVGEIVWRSLQPRPRIDVEIVRADHSAWRIFGPHHYLDHNLNRSARVFVGLIHDQPAVLIAVLSFPHAKWRNAVRISRSVVLPDYQGCGLSTRMTCEIAGLYDHAGHETFITTSHPAMIAGLNRSTDWAMIRKPSRTSKDGGKVAQHATGRMTAGFRYVGPPLEHLAGLLDKRLL